ncbi:MAG TPA: hypothetical protein VFT72_09130 [Opitutaceae bacterium]|nr:hypothetical protein [Opitutaceae bacterium]
MNLQDIIANLADGADDFLEGVTSRDQARAGISEEITLRYVHLSHDDRMTVIRGVMNVLENEDFFAAHPGSTKDEGESYPESEED